MDAAASAPVIELGKVTSKGQITIPSAIRRFLGIDAGDKVVFAANPDGTVTLRNATLTAFVDAQRAFEGAADEAGLEGDEDVMALIRELRAEKAASR